MIISQELFKIQQEMGTLQAKNHLPATQALPEEQGSFLDTLMNLKSDTDSDPTASTVTQPLAKQQSYSTAVESNGKEKSSYKPLSQTESQYSQSAPSSFQSLADSPKIPEKERESHSASERENERIESRPKETTPEKQAVVREENNSVATEKDATAKESQTKQTANENAEKQAAEVATKGEKTVETSSEKVVSKEQRKNLVSTKHSKVETNKEVVSESKTEETTKATSKELLQRAKLALQKDMQKPENTSSQKPIDKAEQTQAKENKVSIQFSKDNAAAGSEKLSLEDLHKPFAHATQSKPKNVALANDKAEQIALIEKELSEAEETAAKESLGHKASKNLTTNSRSNQSVKQEEMSWELRKSREKADFIVKENTKKSEEAAVRVQAASQTQSGERESTSLASTKEDLFTQPLHHTDRNGKATNLVESKATEFVNRETFQKSLQALVQKAKINIVQNGKNTAEIALNPKQLGKVTLNISVLNDKVEGRVLVESEAIKTVLLNELQQFRSDLKSAGLTLESIQIDVRPDGTNANLFAGERDKGFAGKQGDFSPAQQANEEELLGGEDNSYSYDPNRQIDITV
ncbi:MAG: flagellar hook-length control protein FliK [Spirochaetota bacterium]